MQLVVGNIAFSTWSLRPWLVLKRCGADFELTEVQLYGDGYKDALLEVTPSGKVISFRPSTKSSSVAGLKMSTVQESVPSVPVFGSFKLNKASSTGVAPSWAKAPSCSTRY